ncbi:hypothetical protein ACH6EH_07420 [Paenibacillus sp. JSM ZJ436]|uniref:hypothetical protein n=1 Tax=Paenibacillus sp. JSM ZJ436 TaxID=3376190 RepID=UPI0037974070
MKREIKPTIAHLVNQDEEEFTDYALSKNQTNSIGMNRMRERMQQHTESRSKIGLQENLTHEELREIFYSDQMKNIRSSYYKKAYEQGRFDEWAESKYEELGEE